MRIIRILRAACLTALAVLLILFAFIQIQQRILRHRAERLLADFQSIRLHHSTWADAQNMMTRWGAWGHYEGQCTASDCGYTITLSDPTTAISRHLTSETGWRRMMYVARAYVFLSGKLAQFRVTFLVQDGTIWRSGVWFRLDVPPYTHKDFDNFDDAYSLLLSAQARDSLHQKPNGSRVLGADDQLADHPDYKEGRPSGCTNCMASEITFTPYTSPAELKQLTAYNLSCLTRFHYCLTPKDVLPISQVYEPPDPQRQSQAPPQQCGIPVYARARDATDVVLVDLLSSKSVQRPTREEPPLVEVQIASIRIVESLKGTFAAGESFDSVSVASHGNYADSYFERRPQSLQVGKKYLVFPERTSTDSQIDIDFCGAVEDLPTTREQVQQGIAQNDALRHPEEFGGKFW